jgi:hypothetical protein
VPAALTSDPGGPAVLELSTDPRRQRGPVDPMALGLGPDEGVILRLVRDK